MKKSRRTYNGVHLNKKSNTQDVVEQSLTLYCSFEIVKAMFLQKGKFMILECEKCISLHFVPTI